MAFNISSKKIIRGMYVLCISLLCFNTHAQDTLVAKKINDRLQITIKAHDGDNVNAIAARYNVPLAEVISANDATYQSVFKAGAVIYLPIGKYNYKRSEELHTSPLAYVVQSGDKLQQIGKTIGVAQASLQLWNHLPDQTINVGDKLFLGWVANLESYNKPSDLPTPINVQKQEGKPTSSIKITGVETGNQPIITKTESVEPEIDTTVPVKSRKEIYMDSVEQEKEFTYNFQLGGREPLEESGGVTFYKLNDAKAGMYFAFHNNSGRGTMIKVVNPANGKKIYAKVIGPIPNLPEYDNCILVLSGNAATALAAKYKKTFCKLQYR